MDGNKLKLLRIRKGISLSKLSGQTGISKSYLSLIERNIHKNPSIDILGKLAKALGFEVEDLVRTEQDGKELFHKNMPAANSKLKLEFELPADQITPEKLKQIKEFIEVIISE